MCPSTLPGTAPTARNVTVDAVDAGVDDRYSDADAAATDANVLTARRRR